MLKWNFEDHTSFKPQELIFLYLIRDEKNENNLRIVNSLHDYMTLFDASKSDINRLMLSYLKNINEKALKI